MSSATTLNELAERKRLLVMQAELHRQIIDIERFRLKHQVDTARERFHTTRWWLLGGLATAGWLSTRRFGFLVKLVPMAMTAWRIVQKFRVR
jgi:hypothetical protein